MALTDNDRRAILKAVADWTPGWWAGIENTSTGHMNLREEMAQTLAPALGMDEQSALTRMEALRMAG